MDDKNNAPEDRQSNDGISEKTRFYLGFAFMVAIVVLMWSLVAGASQSFSVVKVNIIGALIAFAALVAGAVFTNGAIRVLFKSAISKSASFSLSAVGSAAMFVIVLWWWFSIFSQLINYELVIYTEDAAGRPVKDTRVFLKGVQAFLQAGENYWEFRIPRGNLPPDGIVTVVAEKTSEFLHGSQDVHMIGDTRQTVTIRMQRDRSAIVKGTVIDDETKKGIPQVRVYVEGNEQQSVHTGANGEFEVAAAAGPGEVIRVRAEKDDYEPEFKVAHAGEPTTVEMTRRKTK